MNNTFVMFFPAMGSKWFLPRIGPGGVRDNRLQADTMHLSDYLPPAKCDSTIVS